MKFVKNEIMMNQVHMEDAIISLTWGHVLKTLLQYIFNKLYTTQQMNLYHRVYIVQNIIVQALGEE